LNKQVNVELVSVSNGLKVKYTPTPNSCFGKVRVSHNENVPRSDLYEFAFDEAELSNLIDVLMALKGALE